MAEEKTEKTEVQAEEPSVAPRPGSRLMMMLTIVNTVISVVVIGVLFISLQRERNTRRIEDLVVDTAGEKASAGGAHGSAHGESADTSKKAAGYGKMVTLEQFTVNLSTPGSTTPKYVRVNISLEVPTDQVEAEIGQRMPQVRNAIIDLFNSKRPADVVSEEGRQYLKEEIRGALNGFMVSGKVKGVFFTNFALSG